MVFFLFFAGKFLIFSNKKVLEKKQGIILFYYRVYFQNAQAVCLKRWQASIILL
jgi:hypothetical protein